MLRTIAMTCWTRGSRMSGHWPRHLLNMWSLAAWQARTVFPAAGGYRMVLNTDAAGEAMLVGRLGLPFDEVVTNDLAELPEDMGWLWSLAKLSTYRWLALRRRAFLHLDADFILYRRPVPALLAAPGFCQQLDTAPRWMAPLLASLPRPPRLLADGLAGYCSAGLLGGTDTAAIADFAADAMAAGMAMSNHDALRASAADGDGRPDCLIEQAAFAAAFGGKPAAWVSSGDLDAWDLAGGMHLCGTKHSRADRALVEIQLHALHQHAYCRAWCVAGAHASRLAG